MIIYKITNIINNKIYVGQTTKTLATRFYQHSKALSLIGEEIRKYGIENFKIETVEICETLEKLNEREKFWISELNSKYPNGYNLTDGGERGFHVLKVAKTDEKKSFERQNLILDYLEKNHIGYTVKLSEELGVSPITIHRDFDVMASKGLVTIIRGGAVLNRGTSLLYSLSFRQNKFPVEKKRIAEYCVSLVRDGMTIFIDCGSTAERIAEALLPKKNVTFMTNSLDTAHVLSRNEDSTLIMLPGIFSDKLRGFSGQMTADFMSRFNVDISFLGAQGIDIGGGLSSPDYTDAETKRTLIRQTKKLVVASDHSKFGKIFFEVITRLKDIDLIVTDTDIQPEILNEIQGRGINIVTV